MGKENQDDSASKETSYGLPLFDGIFLYIDISKINL
jgi:hypothetical protein